MKWTTYDRSQVTNLVIALKKAKFDMAGMEIVAFSEVFKWVSNLHDMIEKELTPKPALLTPDKITPAPVPVSTPVTPTKGRKKKSV